MKSLSAFGRQSNIMSSPQRSFEFKSNEIPNLTRTHNIERLMQKPSHKTLRIKFNPERKECIAQMENSTMTM